MNFFQRQRDARSLTRRLVGLFVLAVLGVVVAANLVVVAVLLSIALSDRDDYDLVMTVVLPALMVITTVVAVGCMAVASVRRARALRRGGGIEVVEELGGVAVPPNPIEPRLRRLCDVVEETAIASAVPVPAVYVLPKERGINAFAAGFSAADAALAVTAGALDRLNRDELQGVVAHELSHVVNGDVRLNLRLMGALHGIVALSVVGHRLYDRKNPFAVVGMAMVASGYVGVVVARMVKAAVSRQREYLADASAVQYTRQTAGLAGALTKIAALAEGSALRARRSEEVSHMLFGEGTRTRSWFATHPPVDERIRRLGHAFDPARLAPLALRWTVTPPSGVEEDRARRLAEPPALPDARAELAVEPAELVAAVGDPSPAAHEHAAAVLAALPVPLLKRVRHPDTVVPLVFGLLLATDPTVRAAQLAALAAEHGQDVADAAAVEADAVAGLHPMLRLPLAELAFPALRGKPDPLAAVDALVAADDRVEVFEYCLSRLLRRQLRETTDHTPARRGTLAESGRAVATLLAVLAGVADDPAAYDAGMARVGLTEPMPAVAVTDLDDGWDALDGLAGPDKERLVAGMVSVLGHDGVLAVPELELLRTVCAMLHCPLPPPAREWRLAPEARM